MFALWFAYALSTKIVRTNEFRRAATIGTLAAIIVGSAAGIIISPYFPHNIPNVRAVAQLDWKQPQHSFALLASSYGAHAVSRPDNLPVGMEWYPYAPGALVSDTFLLFLFLALALCAFLAALLAHSAPDDTPRRAHAAELMQITVFFLLTAGGFLIMTLVARRNVEYFVPFAVLFASSLATMAIRLKPRAGMQLLAWIKARKMIAVASILYLMTIAFIASRDIVYTKRIMSSLFPLTQYRGVGTYLQQHAARMPLVAHADWSEFPGLFFWNRNARYLAGLDPTFFYLTDPERFNQWITLGNGTAKNAYRVAHDALRADYIVVGKKFDKMEGLISHDAHFKKIYEDRDANLYQVL